MDSSINCFLRISILLAFACSLIIPVFAVNITSCQILNETEYNLTADITDLNSEICMKVTAPMVSLNCNGHKIVGRGKAGIYSDKPMIIISNCILEGWDRGIDYEGSDMGIMKNVTISSCKTGIYLSSSSNQAIINSTIKGNDLGLYLGFSSGNRIYNNLFNNTNNVKIIGNYTHYWNTTMKKGNRIYSNGIYIGGNYWAKPDGRGYSEICSDSNTDGFCDLAYNLSQNNVDYLPLSNKYTPDLTPPKIKIISPKDNQIINSSEIEIKIQVSDSRLNYVNISAEQNGEIKKSITITESGTSVVKLVVDKGGYYNITATAYDYAGNQNSTKITNILTPIGISKCDNLNMEGENYFLEKDITNEETGGICVNIQADNITLDCRNNTIYYSAHGIITQGIHIDNKKNIIIKNCKIRGWTYGILLENSSKNTIFNSVFYNNTHGICLSSSSNNKIYNNLFNNTNNVLFSGDYLQNFWNIEKQKGNRIYSNGTYIGGNYWAKPDGSGYSEICSDLNTDGFCDESYDLSKNSFSFGVGNFIYMLFTGLFLFEPPSEKNVDYLPLSNKFIPDLIPPNTTIKGIKEDGTNYTFGEWTNSSYVNITLNCSDLRSECDKTFYCIGNDTCEPDIEYSGPIKISGEGITYIRFKSIDTEGNNETTKMEMINILSTEQKILINDPVSNSYLNNHTLTINISILDNKILNYTNISIYNSTGDLVNSTISFENGTFTVNLSVFKDGIYNITATYHSIYGLTEKTVSDNIVVDTVPPYIISFEVEKEYRRGEEASVVCFASDDIKGDFEVVVNLDTSTIGDKTATCTVKDEAGNNYTETRNYTVIEPICEENERRCFGKELQECKNYAWETIEFCDYMCDSSLLKCVQKPVICNEGEKRCSGNNLQICKDNNWTTIQTCRYGCNETRLTCNPNPNPIKLPPMIIVYIVILVAIVGSILAFVYVKLFEKPITTNLNQEFSRLETKIKRLKLQGKNVKEIEKELDLAKQDARIGLLEMAKTRINTIKKKLKKIK